MTAAQTGDSGRRCTFDESARRIRENSRYLAGGASSNFRLGISPTPLVFERGEGACLYDVDGNRLIDYYLGMGPMILGHSPAGVIAAAQAQMQRGILYAGQTDVEAEVARRVCAMVPCAERVRFAGSGSEVVQAAFRLARAATGRTAMVKFEGHYHGWLDNVLWSNAPAPDASGPEDAPAKIPGSKGQDLDAGRHIEVLSWNRLDLLEQRLARGDVAGVIMEAAMCNSGAIQAAPGYLEGVRDACTKHGTILIFDEVITGFRLAPGGAQEKFGVTPDLATFAKAIANGFPVAAIAGRGDILDLFAQGVAHGGTFNGQPIAMAATLATLDELTPELFATIEQRGHRLMDGIRDALAAAGHRAQVTGWGTFFHVAFDLAAPARNWRDLTLVNHAKYVAFTTALAYNGVRALERGAWFMSAAHDDAIIDETLEAVRRAAREIAV